MSDVGQISSTRRRERNAMYAIELLHLRQSSISEDGQAKWGLRISTGIPRMSYPQTPGKRQQTVTSHRLQISSATLWATAVQDDDRHAESKKRDAREERTRGETCVRTAWQTVATDGMQFQLDGIVEGRLGVHGCSVMEDYYSWSLRRLMSESCVSPWHAWAPFVPTVVYCSVALVRNAALQT